MATLTANPAATTNSKPARRVGRPEQHEHRRVDRRWTQIADPSTRISMLTPASYWGGEQPSQRQRVARRASC